MKITLLERPGKCRWCGCTEDHACGAGCSWANRAATLCSACVPLDMMIRTAAGRKGLAEAAATYADEALATENAIAAARQVGRRRRRKGRS